MDLLLHLLVDIKFHCRLFGVVSKSTRMYPTVKLNLFCGLFLILSGQCNSWQQSSNCYPVNNPTSLSNTTLNQLTLEGQCFTACITKYQDIIRPDKFYRLSGEWYSVSYNSFNQNCSYLQKALECQQGCLVRPYTNSRSECRAICYEKCTLACNGTCSVYNDDTVCTRSCRIPPCNRGCIEYTDTILNSVGGGPSPPNGNDLIISNTNSPGIISMSITNTNATSFDVTSFVIKLETDQNVQYIWLPTLINSHLDLTQYTCQYINVSYAPVNRYGRSNFSLPITHYVSGEQRFPQQFDANHIQFVYTEDLRPDYVGNTVVNISWNMPSGLNYATHFELQLRQISNPTIYSYIINKTSHSYLLQASSPGSPPAFGDTYIFTFIVHPSAPGDTVTRLIITPMIDAVTPNMTLSCSHFKTDTLNISLDWEIDNDTSVISTILEYRIKVYDSNGEIIEKTTIANQDDYFQFSQIIGPFALKERSGRNNYTVELTAIKNYDYFWRNVPLPVSCIIDATYPNLSPLTIPNTCINVTATDDDQENLTISWCQPSITYGPLVSYQISLGDTILNIQGNITTQTINKEQYGDCSLLQIRCNNGFDWSNWSQPLLAIPCYNTTTTTKPSSITSSLLLNYNITTTNSITITTTSITPTTSNDIMHTTSTTSSHQSSMITFINSMTSYSSKNTIIRTLLPSSTITTTIVQPTTSSTNTQITLTVYFLLAVIVLLLILIPLTIIGLVLICLRYRQVKFNSLLHANDLTRDPKQDMKFVPSAENKLAVENIYSIISTPV